MQSLPHSCEQKPPLSDSSDFSDSSEEFQTLDYERQIIGDANSSCMTEKQTESSLRKKESIQKEEKVNQNKIKEQADALQRENDRLREENAILIAKLSDKQKRESDKNAAMQKKWEKLLIQNRVLQQTMENLKKQIKKKNSIIKQRDQDVSALKIQNESINQQALGLLSALGHKQTPDSHSIFISLKEQINHIGRICHKISELHVSFCQKKSSQGVKPSHLQELKLTVMYDKLLNIQAQGYKFHRTAAAHREYICKLEKQLENYREKEKSNGLKTILNPVFKLWKFDEISPETNSSRTGRQNNKSKNTDTP